MNPSWRNTLLPLPLSLLAGCSGGGEKKDDAKIVFDGCGHAHNAYEHGVVAPAASVL